MKEKGTEKYENAHTQAAAIELSNLLLWERSAD